MILFNNHECSVMSSSLKRLLHCVIEKLGEGGDETRCLGAIKQLLVEHKERVATSFPALTHLQKCHGK